MATEKEFKKGRPKEANKKVQLPFYLREKAIKANGGKVKFREKILALVEANYPNSTI